MQGLLDMIADRLDEPAMAELSRQSGAPREKLDAAVPAALAMLTSGLANNAQHGGAGGVMSAVRRDHDGTILDNLPAMLSGMGGQHGGGILNHVLGARRPQAEQALSRAGGVDTGSAGSLLAMLAPVVMGALGRQQRERGLDEGGLADLLGGERRRIDQTQEPGLSGLARMLDFDGDGSVMDEITEIGGGLLGGLFGGRR